MGLRDIESTLPPGFRFHPSDEELVCHYLYKKVSNVKVYEGTMVEVDLHTREPWELPEDAKLSESEWYFFSFRDRKYATGWRSNRATKSGYWKATGKDRTVYHPKTRGIVGMRKTLVFHSGRAPNGMKTGWVMHEFRLENPYMPPKEDWVLCKVSLRRKGEQSSSRLENEQEMKLGYSASNLESSPPLLVDQSMLHGCFEMIGALNQEGNSSNNTTLFHENLSVLHNNFLDFQKDMDTTSMTGMDMGMGMGLKYDDYSLFLDGDLLDDNLI